MKKAIMYGAGNIGRGFIGQLFFMSGYETVFIDVDQNVVDRLNRDRKYPIYITDGDDYREFTVENVRAVNGRDTVAVAKEIADADIMATAVGVNALKYIAEPIARAVLLRARRRARSYLNIIVCENMIGADRFLYSSVKELLDGEGARYLEEFVATVEPSIGRMVPKTPLQIAKENPLAVCVEKYCTLPVDRDGFKGDIPDIVNMVPFSPFDFHIRRKLYMHNMSHSLVAYLGYLKGYTYIYQAIEDDSIRKTAADALEEISLALSKEYCVKESELLDFSRELLDRYRNRLLGDTVERVGRDTQRKLSPDDRLVGAILLCQKHGIVPTSMIQGLAAGLCFSPNGDESSATVARCAREKGARVALEKYSNIAKDSYLSDMAEERYLRLTHIQ